MNDGNTWLTWKGASKHHKLLCLLLSEKYIKVSTNLKSSLKAHALDQEAVDVQNVLDLVDRVYVNKSRGQLGWLPGVLKEFQGEVLRGVSESGSLSPSEVLQTPKA